MSPKRKYETAEQAYKAKLDNIRKYNEGSDENEPHYDRLTLRMKAGCKDQLVAYMESKIRQLEALERIANKTPEQEVLLLELKELYSVSKRGSPSVNNLILNLLHKETGINF